MNWLHGAKVSYKHKHRKWITPFYVIADDDRGGPVSAPSFPSGPFDIMVHIKLVAFPVTDGGAIRCGSGGIALELATCAPKSPARKGSATGHATIRPEKRR